MQQREVEIVNQLGLDAAACAQLTCWPRNTSATYR